MRSCFKKMLLLALSLAIPAQAVEKPSSIPFIAPESFMHIPWGDGPGEVGKREARESSPEGPMSFAFSSFGELYILDQVNSRILVFGPDGSFSHDIPLPGSTFQDLEFFDDNSLLVLDRLVRRTLLVINLVSGDTEEFSIMGEGVPEGGGVTAILARPDGVWLEYAHLHSVRVLGPSLQPCPRQMVPFRPARFGPEVIAADLDGEGGATVRAGMAGGRATMDHVVTDSLPVGRIIWLEDDPEGRIWIIYHLVKFDEKGFDVAEESVAGRLLQRDGTPAAMIRSPYTINDLEIFREFRVVDDGSIVQMVLEGDGVSFYRWEVR